jgi:APA family basic amino acid/polyamine antiporter
LGLATATALVVAEVIGVGIFLTTAGMVKSLGSPFWLLAVWLTTGVAAAEGAICFGALAARRPEAGGAYVYLKEAYGRRVAFLFGWLSMLVTDPGITAAVAVGLAHYVSYLVPLSPWGSRAVAIGSIWLLAAVNITASILDPA